MAVLRSPDEGCPWDLQQTHDTLRPYLIEETYEAVDALDRDDFDELKGELGDVLLQCVFHAQLATESRRWTIVDVVEGLTAKLIRRHPHVFTPAGRPLGPARRRALGIDSPGAVKEQWTRLKAAERADIPRDTPRVLAGLPRALPALLRAHKIGTRVAAVGFDWLDAAGVVEKIEEEVRELRAAVVQGRAQTIEEMGDLLFSIANLARKLQIDPEAALSQANDKFTARFGEVEALLAAQGTSVHEASAAALEAAWQTVKDRSSSRSPGGRRSGN
jgi:ATP diphosphatase